MLRILQRHLHLLDLLLRAGSIDCTCLYGELHLLDQFLRLLHHLHASHQSNVLHDVGHDRDDGMRCRLHQRHPVERNVRLNVRFVVLIGECLQRSANESAAVFHCGVHGLRLLRRGQDLVDVLHLERLIHPAVRGMQVVHLRVGLRQLELLLRQSHALRHREDVRVADRQDVHAAVEVLLLELLTLALELIRIHRRHVLGDDPRKDAELLLLPVVQTLVDRRQHLHAALEQSDGCADGLLLTHVLGLHVCYRDEAATALNQCTEQLTKRGRRLFVRQRNDRIADVATRRIDVAELTRLQRLVAVCNAHAARLETSR